MKITEIRLSILSVPLRVPFKTALRRVDSVEDVVVEILTDTDETGYGEAPPTGVITGDTTGAIIGAIRDHIAPKLIGRDIDDFENLTRTVQCALVHNTSAKAAVDMALWDLYGKRWGLSVCRMLGASRREIETDITISVNDPDEMAKDTEDAIRRGYRTSNPLSMSRALRPSGRRQDGTSGSGSTPIRHGHRSRRCGFWKRWNGRSSESSWSSSR